MWYHLLVDMVTYGLLLPRSSYGLFRNTLTILGSYPFGAVMECILTKELLKQSFSLDLFQAIDQCCSI
jgi:hypothetical protein